MPGFKYREPVRAIVGGTVYQGAPLTVYDLRQEGGPRLVLYADPGLTVPHPTPLVADAAGRYPPIYTTAVKPLYALDEQPRDHAGNLMPGATLTFYEEDTTELAPIYSDEDLQSEASNPATADENGEFAPIYLDEAVRYRAVLKDQNGRLIYDMAVRAPWYGNIRVVAEGAFDVDLDLYDDQYSNLVLFPWEMDSSFPGAGGVTGLNPDNYHRCRYLLQLASASPPNNNDQLGSWHGGDAEDDGFIAARDEGNAASWVGGEAGEYQEEPIGWSLNRRTMYPAHAVTPGEAVNLYVHFNKVVPTYLQGVVAPASGPTFCRFHANFIPPLDSGNAAGRFDWWSPRDSGENEGVPISGVWGAADSLPAPRDGNNCIGSQTVAGGFFRHPDAHIIVQRVPRPPLGYGWVAFEGEYHALAVYTEDGLLNPSVTQYPLNPIVEIDSESDTEEFWTAAYEAAVEAGDMPAGLTYGDDYPVAVDTMYHRKYYG